MPADPFLDYGIELCAANSHTKNTRLQQAFKESKGEKLVAEKMHVACQSQVCTQICHADENTTLQARLNCRDVSIVYVPIMRSIQMLHAVRSVVSADSSAMVRNHSWSLLPVRSWVTQGDIQIGPYPVVITICKRDVKHNGKELRKRQTKEGYVKSILHF